MSYERYETLHLQAEELENGPERVAIREEAIREADRLRDVLVSFHARMCMVHDGVFGDAREKAMVAFSWCLAQYDADPQTFELYSSQDQLLWRYKWILGGMTHFPQMSREQLESMSDDMQRRYLAAGYSLRPVHYMRWDNYMQMGDFEKALSHVEKWRDAPRDEMADCLACEQHRQVELMAHLQEDEKAVELAQPIFDEQMSCSEIPEMTYGEIVMPLMRLGRSEEAMRFYQISYPRLAKSREYLRAIAAQLLLLVHRGELAQGIQLLEKHTPWAAASSNANYQFFFYLSAALLLESLPDSSCKLRLPAGLPVYRDDGVYSRPELAGWFRRQAEDLAGRFDRRNGNDYHARQVRQRGQLATAR
jgi:tetratricopeptide (TPR) repeat protein